jgi:hypothetical protein
VGKMGCSSWGKTAGAWSSSPPSNRDSQKIGDKCI